MPDFTDITELQELSRGDMDADMNLFENRTKEERFLYDASEQRYRIARAFEWRIEGGEL